MNLTLKKQIEKAFFQTLQDLKNTKEKEIFFKDFFNEVELEIYIKRLAIAYWIKRGRDSENIMQNLHVSLMDVKKIEKIMNSDGIKLALKYLEAEDWANVWSGKIKKYIH